MLEAIDSRPFERHTVAELAELVHLSPSYCSVIFMRECGISISEYVSRKRLEYGAELLAKGESVGAAAEKSGFCDVYYFSRVFTSRIGMTPTEYRRGAMSTPDLPEYKVERIYDQIHRQKQP